MTSLGTVQGHVADQFVQTLAVELFADRANARFSSFAFAQLLVEVLLERYYVETRRGFFAHVLDPSSGIFHPFSIVNFIDGDFFV
jgi:hypothetical protein